MSEKVRLSIQQLSTQHSILVFLLVGGLTCAIRLSWLLSTSDAPAAAPQPYPSHHATAELSVSNAEELQVNDLVDELESNDIELQDDRDFDSAWLRELTLSSVDRRLEAIDALGQPGNTKAVMILRELLDDPDALVREEAVEALARIGDLPSIAGLGYALSDEIEMVRLLAVDNLAEIGSDEALTNLAVVTTDEDRAVRISAIEALAESSSTSSTMMLQLFLADEDDMVRHLVSEHLGNQNDVLP